MEGEHSHRAMALTLGLAIFIMIGVLAHQAGVSRVIPFSIFSPDGDPIQESSSLRPIEDLSFSFSVDLSNLDEEETLSEESFSETLPEPPEEKLVNQTVDNTPTQEEPLYTFGELNTRARSAVVNILCTTSTGGLFKPASGSGVIVDPRGIVLTNAHVGQYFLLEKYNDRSFFDCILRTGSPARATYTAKLLYISEEWVEENAFKITEETPLGNGRNDYAILAITGYTDSSKGLPENFPYVPINTSRITEPETDVLIAGYPAGFLSGQSIQKDLHIASTIASIDNVFTYTENTVDLFTLSGVILAQGGASGSPVIDTQGEVTGLVVTSTDGETTGERTLGAITIRHIDRSLLNETGQNLDLFFQNDLANQLTVFEETTKPRLISILEEVLE